MVKNNNFGIDENFYEKLFNLSFSERYEFIYASSQFNDILVEFLNNNSEWEIYCKLTKWHLEVKNNFINNSSEKYSIDYDTYIISLDLILDIL